MSKINYQPSNGRYFSSADLEHGVAPEAAELFEACVSMVQDCATLSEDQGHVNNQLRSA